MRVRTGFSFKSASGHLNEVQARLQAIGWPCLPISDRCSTYAWANWAKAANAAGLPPVYGVELAVVPNSHGKNPPVDFWTFYAKQDVRVLHALVTQATARVIGAEPCLTYAEALAATGCIKIAGERCQLAQVHKKFYGKGKDLYLALSPALPHGLYKSAKSQGWPFIATSSNAYTNAADREFYRVAIGKRAAMQSYPQHILDDDEWRAACAWVDKATLQAALRTRAAAFKVCKATLPRATLLQPKRPTTLRTMCSAGARDLNVDLQDPIYKQRLDRELKMIAEKNFEDYFYIVAELVTWAKQRMVVGPARGSSCGSLVCYLLGITAVDPIPFGLLFERFIDVTRNDLPDIDIDFSDAHRDEVFAHAEELYGAERVARLGTVSHYKARSALNAAAAALRIPSWQVDKVADSMIERTSGDARANEALADTFKATEAGRKLLADWPALTIATRLEGHPTNAGQHAAGLVLTNGAVADYVAIDARTGAAMCDKRDVDTFGLLKIDALGLTQLSVFERTLELIGREPRAGFLEGIPLDDPAAFAVLNKQNFAGVFQFNGIAVQSMAKGVQANHINDIVVMTALGRPGPMGSGGAQHWARRRNKQEQIVYAHPLVEPYLAETLGVITYQEQVMQLGRGIGDLSWGDVTALRKAMSKSMGQDYFDQFGSKWKTAAQAKGMPEATADKFWLELCTFGNWGFNKSHAVAYGLVSYWCLWFKAYYPVEFAAATLDAETDPARQIALLRELKVEGIEYRPVDIHRSTDRWTPIMEGNTSVLVGPLTAIKNIGPAKAKAIMDCRKSNKPLPTALAETLANAKTQIQSLYPVADRIAALYPTLEQLDGQNKLRIKLPSGEDLLMRTKPKNIREVQANGNDHEVMIIGVVNKIAPKDENEAVNVAKRGGIVYDGPHLAVNLFFKDDTDQIFAKINRYDYDELSKDIIERGGLGQAIYAVKGVVPRDFRMIKVRNYKFLGYLEDLNLKPPGGGTTSDDDKKPPPAPGP
jgi:DNA-directed DNA polymerase III PolC